MRKFIVGMLFSISATSAFAQVCEVDMVDSYSRIIKTFRAYGDARTCVEGMKQCRKEITLSRSRQGLDCVRRTHQQPNPYPQNPYPQNPSQYYGVSVTGTSFGVLFTFTGRDISDLDSVCRSQMGRVQDRARRGAAKRLYFSVNNNRFVYKTNHQSPCDEIINEARRTYPMPNMYNHTVAGNITQMYGTSHSYFFEGPNRETLLRGCMAAASNKIGSGVDELTVSLNGGYSETLRTSGFWNSEADVCREIISTFDSRI